MLAVNTGAGISWENRERIRVLETDIAYMKKSVAKIIDNHLPHIHKSINDLMKDISDIKVDIARYTTKFGILISIGSAIVQFIIGYVFKN